MKATRWVLLVCMTMLSAACGDQGPKSGPGTMTATLVGPNGAEGAAVVVLLGGGVGTITPIGATDAYSSGDHSSTQIVLINPTGGELSFQVAVADTTAPPAFVVQEVAGLDDELRAPLTGYTLGFSR